MEKETVESNASNANESNANLEMPKKGKIICKFLVRGIGLYLLLAVVVTACLFFVYIRLTSDKADSALRQVENAISGVAPSEKYSKFYNTPLLANTNSDVEYLDLKSNFMIYKMREQMSYNEEGTEVAGIVYDITNNKEYARTERGIFIFLKQMDLETEKATIQSYFLSANKAPELYEDYVAEYYNSLLNHEDAYIIYESLYLAKDGSFLPGKCQLVCEKENKGAALIAEYDYTPSDLENYVEVIPNESSSSGEISLFNKHPICFETFFRDAEKSEEMMEELEPLLKENIISSDEERWANTVDDKKIGFGTVDYYKIASTTNEFYDRDYAVALAMHFNMWQNWAVKLIIGYTVSFGLFIILFIGLGTHSYHKQKNKINKTPEETNEKD